ncbi:MAG: hypothetical protein A2W90_02555 [Bacteroidetes bacterium GWF2_42_66]|nr:MAG: hypothetical protein A2W92_19605 [Bacteroidetes bacterium GWA2_42_15]OFY01232.1 MAG: hypothetical protein A2W89_16040 [Bacteroidetes bacterium GWE2_42_39]OFY42075.1 MAG: hypothetical protein A2W90_02555 [Bacteroidetes bacterium GWF2_42_66]
MTAIKKQPYSRGIDEKVSIREESDGKRYFDFYASVFNQQSKLIRDWDGTYYEIIASEAFNEILASENLNVLATVDHWRDKMLGRTKSGTCQLTTDTKGLLAVVEIPDTTLGKDTAVLVARGDYYECSFIFYAEKADITWDRSADIPIRTVHKISRLWDVSIVIDGAYANTSIATRSTDWQLPDDEPAETTPPHHNAQAERDILQKRITILKHR